VSLAARFSRPAIKRHYAWLVVGSTFLVILVSAGVRAAPGALLTPLQADFGWSRGSISLAVAVSILFYGFAAPVSGTLVDRFGPRRIALAGAALIAAGLAPLLLIGELWQFFALWGVVIGVGTGALGSVIGATVALRWFRTHRGAVVGLFAAASSAGQFIFLPSFVAIIDAAGWRIALGVAAVAVLGATIPALFFLRDRPSDVGRAAYGDDGSAGQADADRAEAAEGVTIRQAIRTPDFWLLAGSFFVCGYTSNGLIGTHLISAAHDHGFSDITAASAVGVMGMMNVFGTLASGWATDRFDNRKLLAAYYGFRAISITWLPAIYATQWLFLFAIVYGLDWIATVPPTTNLTAKLFGRAHLGQIYGCIFCSHMIGAALAAWLAGTMHDLLGDYTVVFVSAGLLGFVAAGMALRISVAGRAAVPPAFSPPIAPVGAA
jgi:MFS family permease